MTGEQYDGSQVMRSYEFEGFAAPERSDEFEMDSLEARNRTLWPRASFAAGRAGRAGLSRVRTVRIPNTR